VSASGVTEINTIGMKTHFKTNAFQPLSALSDITVPDEFSVQLALHESGYMFTIKNAKNRRLCALPRRSGADLRRAAASVTFIGVTMT
jgi:hypothetical protein